MSILRFVDAQRASKIAASLVLATSLSACGVTVQDIDSRAKFRHLPSGSEQLNDIEVELYQKAVQMCGTAMNVKGVNTRTLGEGRDVTSADCHYPAWVAPFLKPDPA